MPHWKVILTYDGTPFNGWQIQPTLPTVQGTLADALHRVTGETVLPQGSGRTDTGVHALGQVTTFTIASPIPAPNLHRALNNALPPSIRILTVESVPDDFHARHSAQRKTYEYRIFPRGLICSPFLAPYVWHSRYRLNLEALQQAAAHVIGTHDFTSFAASDPDLTARALDMRQEAIGNTTGGTSFDAIDSPRPAPPSVISTEGGTSTPVVEKSASLSNTFHNPNPSANTILTGNIRTIYHSVWHQQNDLLIYRVIGSGFLHHMVRNLVGTFVLAGAGRISPEYIPAILNARNRSAAGPTAPARGLFLVEVEY